MKVRIAIWAVVGALVVVLWTIYISAASRNPRGPLLALVYLTCPVGLAHHHSLGFYFVLVVNTATYAAVGTVVEAVRRHYKKQPRLISP
jgi:hypothetical protein